MINEHRIEIFESVAARTMLLYTCDLSVRVHAHMELQHGPRGSIRIEYDPVMMKVYDRYRPKNDNCGDNRTASYHEFHQLEIFAPMNKELLIEFAHQQPTASENGEKQKRNAPRLNHMIFENFWLYEPIEHGQDS